LKYFQPEWRLLYGESASVSLSRDCREEAGLFGMAKTAWRILAFSALMGGLSSMASAQMVVGGDGRPSVEVNWAVLESLGQDPNLAGMLRQDRNPQAAPSVLPPAAHGKGDVVYRPFSQVTAKAPAAPRKATPVAVKAVKPVKAERPALAELVQATTRKAEPAPLPVSAPAPAVKAAPAPVPVAEPKAVVPPKPEIAEVPLPKASPSKPAGPQISLPEVPAPKAEPAKPVAVAAVPPAPPAVKAEPPALSAPMPIAKVEPPAAPAPMPLAAPTPPPVPKAAPQVAAVAPAAVVSRGDTLSVLFSGEDFHLPDSSHGELTALARRMEKDDSLNLQLLAFASGDEAGASKARRLSLSRAIEVRKFLLERGVRSTRIEMRALGNKQEGAGPADRVDAVLVGH